MKIIARLLQDLGFKKIVGVLDKGKENERASLTKEFPKYNFFCIPAEDVRTKRATPSKDEVVGLIEKKDEYRIRDEYKDAVKSLFHQINSGLNMK